MPNPVNKIKFKFDESRTSGRELRIFVDGVDLFDLLEESTEKCPHPGQWSDKDSAVLNIRTLEKSMSASGSYPLIGSMPLPDHPEDVLLRDFDVCHDAEYVTWQTSPPGAGVHFETDRKVEFCFHKSQYLTEIKKLISNARSKFG